MERPTTLYGIHHFKLAVNSIEKTKDFYINIIGLEYFQQYDHRQYDHRNKEGELFAIILGLNHRANPLNIELRRNPEQAQKQQRWDPVTWGVATKADLDGWKEWFVQQGVKCSKVFTGMQGWVLCALDPDEKFVRIYCDETHEWTSDVDVDEFWLE